MQVDPVQAWVYQGHLQYRTGSTKATYSTGLGLPRPPAVQDWVCQGHLQYRTGSTKATYSTGLGLPRPPTVQDWVRLGFYKRVPDFYERFVDKTCILDTERRKKN